MERLPEALGLVPGNPLRPFTLGLLVIFGLAVVFAAVVAAFAPFWALIAVIIAAAVLISLLVIVPFARRYVRDMRRLLAGEAWVRWHFDPEEWERFSARELARSRREATFGAVVSPILAIVIGLIAGASDRSGAATLLTGGLVLAVGWVVALGILVAGRARYARRRTEAGVVTIGPLGIHHPGRYLPLTGFNLRPHSIEVEPGSPMTLRFETQSWSQYGTRTREYRVPVPKGHGAEATKLVDRLRAHFEIAPAEPSSLQ